MAEEAETTGSPCCAGGAGGGGCRHREGEREDGGEGRWRWLASTVELQRDYFGHPPIDPEDVGAQARTLKENVLAIVAELGEVLREFHWKYWVIDRPWISRERLLDELVDVGHFLANCLTAIHVTDDEWEAAYQRKQEKNRQRMLSKKYSAIKEKE